jgi:hypothetical protein
MCLPNFCVKFLFPRLKKQESLLTREETPPGFRYLLDKTACGLCEKSGTISIVKNNERKPLFCLYCKRKYGL